MFSERIEVHQVIGGMGDGEAYACDGEPEGNGFTSYQQQLDKAPRDHYQKKLNPGEGMAYRHQRERGKCSLVSHSQYEQYRAEENRVVNGLGREDQVPAKVHEPPSLRGIVEEHCLCVHPVEKAEDETSHHQQPTAPDERDKREGPARLIMRSKPDRKSTRLNSSHSQISYAVFCLKKKKKRN